MNGGRAIFKTGAPPRPTIQLLGAAPPVTLSNASQTVRVTGPVGASVTLLQTEAGLFTAGLPGGGFDIDPFEANSVISVTEKTATIGSAGYVDIPITLTKSQTSAGLNHLVATIKDAGGRSGPTSSVLVVQFSPGSQPQNQAPIVSAGGDQLVTLPGTASLQGSVSDDGLPAGSTPTIVWSKVSGPGTVNFANSAAAVTSASFSAAGTYVLRLTASDGQLASNDDVSVTVNAASTLSVLSFTLINANTDQPIAGFDPLVSFSTLNLATLPTRNLNVRANLSTTSVGSVRFALDANANYNTENVAPFSIGGDSNGNFNAWTPVVGAHTIKATPFSGANGGGTAGTPLTISINVIDNAAIVPGDHNLNGQVDAADFVLWRKTGVSGQQGYTDWRTHFGQIQAAGAGSSEQIETFASFRSTAGPEPERGREVLESISHQAAGATNILLDSAGPANNGSPSVLSLEPRTEPAKSHQFWITMGRGSTVEGLELELAILAKIKPAFRDKALLSWSRDGGCDMELATPDDAGRDATSLEVADAVFDMFAHTLGAVVGATSQ